MSWSPLQRETLEAMGLPVYRATAVAADGVVGVSVLEAAAADDPLLRALLRAAGRTADDAGALSQIMPASRGLRGHPQAKRALWPTLRALRRGPG